MKQGLLFDILPDGWKYISTSCSCQGKSQHEMYRNGTNFLKHYFKKNTYTLNNAVQKPIQEISTEFKN